MEEILGPLFPAVFVLALILERVFPREKQAHVRFWLVKGTLFFIGAAVLNTALPAMVASVTQGRSLLDLRGLGTLAGAAAVFLVGDFINYWLHRAFHKYDTLWLWTHQMHHSAERVDVAGFTYAHPIENILSVGMASVVSAALGVTPDAAAIGGFLGFFVAVFQHLNMKTPHWLGYLIQRPEMHAVHHTRGIHAYNYGSFMLWDIVFGTFRNPVEWREPFGFWDGASKLLWPMLIGRDVSKPVTEREAPGSVSNAKLA